MPATIRQIAEELGLSRPTVSHVLNNRGRFKEETRQRVFDTAQKLGYVPNGAARAMRLQRTNQVGVLVANNLAHQDHTPQNYLAILGLNDGLQAMDYILSVVRVGDVIDTGGPQLPRVFRERLLDGVVVLNANPPLVQKRVAQLGTLAKKIIWADSDHWEEKDCIRPDEYMAGKLAAQALIEGHARRFIWLDPEINTGEIRYHYSFHTRMAGIQDVAREAGVEIVRLPCDLRGGGSGFTEALRPYLKPGNGLIAYDLSRARLAISIAMPMRLCAGVDFGLVVTELLPDVDWNWPQLTCAGFDRYAFGREAADMVMRILEAPDEPLASRLFPSALIKRSTHMCG